MGNMVRRAQTMIFAMVARVSATFVPLLGYVALTALYTLPWSAHLTSRLPAGGDGLLSVWWFSHFRGAFSGRHGLFTSSYVFHPISDVFLPSHTPISIAVGALGLPVSVLGDVAAFNISAFAAFVLTGYGTYLLVGRLTGNPWASFVAGCVPAFAPYQYASFVQGHVDAMTTQWFPFAMLFSFRLLERAAWCNAFGLGVFSALVLLVSPYFAIVYVVYVAIFVAWYARSLASRRTLGMAGVALAVTAVLTVPFYGPILHYRLGGGGGWRSVAEFDFYSNDLLGFFVPPPGHPLFSGLTSRLYHDNVPGTLESYVGLTVLLVALWVLVRSRRSAMRFFGIVLVAFFILSLGSSLHVGRLRVNFTVSRGVWGVPPDTPLHASGQHLHPVLLPGYYLHQYVPLFGMLRYPTRFLVPFTIAVAVLFGAGLSEAMPAGTSRRRALGVTLVALGVLTLEYLHPPAGMFEPPVSPFYRRLAQEPGDFAILQIPIAPHAEYLYYQTIHAKRIMIGYMSVPVPSFMRLVQETPFLYAASNAELPGKWGWGEPRGSRPLDAAEIVRTMEQLRTWNVRYVVYHRDLDPVRDKNLPRFFDAMAAEGRAIYADASVVAITPDVLRAYPQFIGAGAAPH
jgi:hypothetical protein